jgi:hypothetical protein
MTDEEPKSQPETCRLRFKGHTPTVIVGQSLALHWFKDAIHESQGDSWHNVRREIIFSATFLESYLFDWAQNQLINDIGLLLDEFPHEGFIPSLTNKWGELVSKVFRLRSLGNPPAKENPELERLVNYRNRLLHGQTSRLEISSVENLSWPIPSVEELKKLGNGWALSVSLKCVQSLHFHAGSEVPEYLKPYITT